jgi:hypothetical protein
MRGQRITINDEGRRGSLAALIALLCSLLFTLAPPLSARGHNPVREVEARLAAGRLQAVPEQPPEVRADLALLLSGAEASPTCRLTLRGLMMDAPRLATGTFELTDLRGQRLFAGRWVATAFRAGASLLSLEGEGDGPYAASRLKLKLKVRARTEGAASTLSGEGRGEIR